MHPANPDEICSHSALRKEAATLEIMAADGTVTQVEELETGSYVKVLDGAPSKLQIPGYGRKLVANHGAFSVLSRCLGELRAGSLSKAGHVFAKLLCCNVHC